MSKNQNRADEAVEQAWRCAAAAKYIAENMNSLREGSENGYRKARAHVDAGHLFLRIAETERNQRDA